MSDSDNRDLEGSIELDEQTPSSGDNSLINGANKVTSSVNNIWHGKVGNKKTFYMNLVRIVFWVLLMTSWITWMIVCFEKHHYSRDISETIGTILDIAPCQETYCPKDSTQVTITYLVDHQRYYTEYNFDQTSKYIPSPDDGLTTIYYLNTDPQSAHLNKGEFPRWGTWLLGALMSLFMGSGMLLTIVINQLIKYWW